MDVALSPDDVERETEPAIDEAVARVLNSPQFARAETQRKLLLYLWQHRHATVSEYAIATEALGRNSNFDPNTDASIRVHVSRLRRKLKDYYLETAEPEVLVIPTGTYQLVVREPVTVATNPASAPTPEGISPQDQRPWLHMHALQLLSALCLLLVISLIALLAMTIRQHQQLKAVGMHPPERANSFWNSFLSGDAPVKIVLPTPIFFNFANHPWLKMRSTKVNEFDELAADPEFKAMVEKLGPMELEQSYTVTWDTLAAIKIARYLDRIGQGDRVSFEVTRDSSLLSLEQANVIVLGTDNTLRPMHEYTDSMNFVMTPGEEKVLNTHPEKNEQPAYERVIQAPDRHIEPSIIALLPGRAAGLKVLMLESRDTSGMVSLLASNAGSHSVEAMWRSHGSPKFFEMVVMTEMEGHTPLRTWPVAIHAYTKSPPSLGL